MTDVEAIRHLLNGYECIDSKTFILTYLFICLTIQAIVYLLEFAVRSCIDVYTINILI